MKSRISDRIATTIIILCAVVMVGILAFLLGYILLQGVHNISWSFLTSESSAFAAGGGIKNQLWNSFYILILTLIISVPLGVAGGIYLAEYAKPSKATAVIRTCVEVLSSLPSIVVGLFGLLIFVNYFHLGFSVLAGALALTVFNLPVLVRVSEDSIRSVDPAQKEASLALGMTHWHTIKKVIVPTAFPGILTGIILSAGRIFGESAALIFTAGLSSPNLNFSDWNPADTASPLNPMRSAETLSVHIWQVNTNGIIQDIDVVSTASAAVLVLFILLFNLAARIIGAIIQRRISGSK